MPCTSTATGPPQVTATNAGAVNPPSATAAASARNGCVYCVAAHSSGARMAKLDKDAIAEIRDGTPIADAKLQALRAFTEAVLETLLELA